VSLGLQLWWGANIHKPFGDRGKGTGGLPLIVVVLCVLVVSAFPSDFVCATLIELGSSLYSNEERYRLLHVCMHTHVFTQTHYTQLHTHYKAYVSYMLY